MRRLFFIFGFLIFGPLTAYLDRTIVSDFSLRGETLEYANIQITDPKCTSFPIILHQCSFSYKIDEQSISLQYTLIALRAPKGVYLLKGSQTGRITSSTGQEYLWHRVVTVFLGFIVSGITLLTCISSLSGPKQPSRPIAPSPQQFVPKTRLNNPNNGGQQSFGKRSRYS